MCQEKPTVVVVVVVSAMHQAGTRILCFSQRTSYNSNDHNNIIIILYGEGNVKHLLTRKYIIVPTFSNHHCIHDIMSESSFSSLQEIVVGPAGPLESLRKLCNGCCRPKRERARQDKEINTTRIPHTSRNDEQKHPKSVKKEGGDAPDTRGLPVRNDENVIATSFGRRQRVIRGLEVALVALMAVFATLYTLHRWGYVADLQFDSANNITGQKSGRNRTPLIKIQKNEKTRTKSNSIKQIL